MNPARDTETAGLKNVAKHLKKFLSGAGDDLKEISERLMILEGSPGNREALDSLFYAIHTLKGNSAFLGLKTLTSAAHEAEEVLDGAKSNGSEVSPDEVDSLWKTFGIISGIIQNAASGAGPGEGTGSPGGRTPGKPPRQDNREEPADASGTEDLGIQTRRAEKCFAKFREGRPEGNREFISAMEKIESALDPGSAEAALAGGIRNDFEAMVEDTGLPGEGLLKILEEDFEKLREAALKDIPPPTLRVEERKIDEVLSYVRKMDGVKTALSSVRDKMIAEGIGLPGGMVLEFQKTLNDFNRISREMLQELISMKTSSPGPLLEKTKDLIGALAKNCRKKIRIEVGSEDVFIPRSKLEMLEPALMHIVRNCIDHGIEEPEERLNKAKPEEGLIKISAAKTSEGARITVSDDGRGIDPAALKQAALRERNAASEETEGIISAQGFELVFMPGLSTARAATEISGRGMGLNAARELVKKTGGSIKIHSEPGRGTTVELDLPGAGI